MKRLLEEKNEQKNEEKIRLRMIEGLLLNISNLKLACEQKSTHRIVYLNSKCVKYKIYRITLKNHIIQLTEST